MLKLDATTKSLEVKLAGAVATTQCPWYASWVEGSQITAELAATSANDGTTNGATAVTVIAAPAANLTRKLDYFSLVNVDTAVVVVTVQVNISGTKRITGTFTLQIGDNLSFTDAGGWLIIDTNGNQKTSMQIAPLTITNAMLGGSIAASKLIGTDIATVGTITSGVWNAGALTTSGAVTAVGNIISTGIKMSVTPVTATDACYFNSVNGGGQIFFGQDSSVGGSFGFGNYAGIVYSSMSGGMAFVVTAGSQRFYTNSTLRVTISAATGALTLAAHVAGTPTWVAGDKYLLVDANGNVHVSALGPLS